MEHLLKTALLGTGKGAVQLELTDEPADQLAGKCGFDTVERGLLIRAGAWTTCQLAGLIPQVPTELPKPAAADDCPPCLPRASEILVELLRRNQHDLLEEAFQLLVRSGQRLPSAILPQVLESWDPKAFATLIPVLGNRGRWLCQFHETWSKSLAQIISSSVSDGDVYSSPAELEQIWNEGTLSERKAALSSVRRVDPNRGRQWLESVWSTERADTRADLLEKLAIGIVPGDLTFLEQTLADTSKRVRAVAAQFLCRFDESGLAKRMRGRAETMVAYTPSATQGRLKSLVRSLTGAKSGFGKLCITLPEEFDKQWEKDGIQEKPPAGTGKREFWLVQVMEHISPIHWEEHFHTSAVDLIHAAQDDDFGTALIGAWSKAAQSFQCSHWMAALWDFWNQWKPKKEQPKDRERAEHWIKELLQAMSDADREPRALSLLERSIREQDSAFCQIAEILPRPWNTALAQKYLSHIKGMAASASKESYGWINTLALAARAIPRQCFGEALRPWALPEGEEYHVRLWQKAVDEFRDIVRLRSEFYEVVTSKK